MINNHGADGYYIKESPEFLPSKSYSLENTRKLIESIKDGIKRSQQLEKYWIRINKLTEKIESNADLSPEMKSSGVKNLNVVFSLLSSEYSRTNFEKENSEYRAELAFVSLWGILNLINEFFYTKISEQKEVRQKLQGKIPNKIIEENNFKIIVLKENKEVLFVVNDNWKKIHYKAIGKQKRKLKINNLVECNQNDTQHLIYQIGFIILNGLDIDDKRKKELEEDLITLNKFRNTLSIIHGVDLDDPILENQAKHENEGILKKTFSLLELVEKILTSPTKKEESLANKLRKLENKEW
jgi:hypothetical protein